MSIKKPAPYKTYICKDAYDKHPTEILPFLYLGDASHGTDYNTLLQHQFTHILNISQDSYEKEVKQIKYKFLKIADHPESKIEDEFQSAWKFIEEAEEENGKILVHCGEGVSRSTTIVLSFLMYRQGWNLLQCYQFVKKRRPQISPNNGFMKKLIQLENQLFGKNSLKKELFADDWGFGCLFLDKYLAGDKQTEH